MTKKRLYILITALIVGVLVFGLRIILGGNEDTWLCRNGQWIAHGKPLAPKPLTGCGSSIGMVAFVFQPKQCEQTPWRKWYATGEAKFAKEPTETELIAAYFSSQNIQVSEIQRVSSSKIVCDACSICPTSYYFQLKASNDSSGELGSLGWSQK